MLRAPRINKYLSSDMKNLTQFVEQVILKVVVTVILAVL